MTTTLNATLAYRVLDRIEADPHAWDQTHWIKRTACGTAACFAGRTVLLSGYEPVFSISDPPVEEAPTVRDSDGNRIAVPYLAERLLGKRYRNFIDEDAEPDEEDLFAAYNTIDDLRRIVAAIFGPRPHSDEVTPS